MIKLTRQDSPIYEDDKGFCISIKDCTPIPYSELPNHIGLDKCVYKNDKGKLKINYPNTVEAIGRINDLACVGGVIYSPEGVISDSAMRKDISESLVDAGWTEVLDAPVSHILASIKDTFYKDTLPVDKKTIPFANGDLHLLSLNNWEFRLGEKRQTAYRLSANFIENSTPKPWFTRWMNDIFMEEDIKTVQEMMGYFMLPRTDIQEAFVLVGEAGAGKSILTHLISAIFGNAYLEMSVKDLSENRFYLAETENKLVVYDDDLKTDALKETGVFKKLVTADKPITAERKYSQPTQFLPYCKIIANSNDMLQSLYDDSEGFFRRLHPIHVKNKAQGRKNIANLPELIIQERDSITHWALAGLRRLMKNNWKITWSERSKRYMNAQKIRNMPFPSFLDDVFELGGEESTATKDICRVYKIWCKQNAMQELSDRRLQNWLSENIEKYNIKKCQLGKRRLSGYEGLKLREEWKTDIVL